MITTDRFDNKETLFDIDLKAMLEEIDAAMLALDTAKQQASALLDLWSAIEPAAKQNTLTLPLVISEGGTGAVNAPAGRQNLGINNLSVDAVGAVLQNPKYLNLKFVSSADAVVDIYTCPPGRKALIFRRHAHARQRIKYALFLKINGVYERLITEITFVVGQALGATNETAILLNEGETFSVYAHAADFNAWFAGIEFDLNTPIKKAQITSWTAGDNILLTCPAGKSILLLDTNTTAHSNVTETVNYTNRSGASRTVKIFFPKDGETTNPANRIASSQSVANDAKYSVTAPGSLNEGDSIVINVDASTETQYAWVNYLEV